MKFDKCISTLVLVYGLANLSSAEKAIDNTNNFYPKMQASGSCLVINEVHVRPTGFYGQKTREYIELYNSSTTDTVDLTGWYIRTDLANDVLNPIFGDNMIVPWAQRYPGTTPFDSIVGWLDTNTIMIPPKGIAVIMA